MDLLLKHSASLEAVTEVRNKKLNLYLKNSLLKDTVYSFVQYYHTEIITYHNVVSLCMFASYLTVGTDATACVLFYGSSKYSKVSDAKRSFTRCLKCGKKLMSPLLVR